MSDYMKLLEAFIPKRELKGFQATDWLSAMEFVDSLATAKRTKVEELQAKIDKLEQDLTMLDICHTNLARADAVARRQLAELVASARTELGLTLEQVAELSGVSEDALKGIEVDSVVPPGMDMIPLMTLADVLQVPRTALIHAAFPNLKYLMRKHGYEPNGN